MLLTTTSIFNTLTYILFNMKFGSLFSCIYTLEMFCYLCVYNLCCAELDRNSGLMNNNKDSADESLNHTHDSTGSAVDIAEFSDEEELPLGRHSYSLFVAQFILCVYHHASRGCNSASLKLVVLIGNVEISDTNNCQTLNHIVLLLRCTVLSVCMKFCLPKS